VDFLKASAFALAGAVMTYFGFMHGEAVGIGGGFGVTPSVAFAYPRDGGWFSTRWAGPAVSVPYTAHMDMPHAAACGVIEAYLSLSLAPRLRGEGLSTDSISRIKRFSTALDGTCG